jgi:hypothetical protein
MALLIILGNKKKIPVHVAKGMKHRCIYSHGNGSRAFLNSPQACSADACAFTYKLAGQLDLLSHLLKDSLCIRHYGNTLLHVFKNKPM